MSSSILNRTIVSIVGTLALALTATAAQAITYQGNILSNSDDGLSVVHETPLNAAGDWLRFEDGAAFTFDVTGLTVSAAGPQSYTLMSNNGATADFVLVSMLLELDADTGIPSGTIEYMLDGVGGTFTFLEQTYGDTGFNSSSFDGNAITVAIWGADAENSLGLDFVFTGTPVPVPPALLMFGSALAALGMRRRSRTV